MVILENNKKKNQKIKKLHILLGSLTIRSESKKVDLRGFGNLMEAGSWVTGIHWQLRSQSNPEDKDGREGKKVGKGQKVDQTKDSQRRKQDGKGKMGGQK